MVRAIEFVLGAVVAWVTLRDVFQTVVVPGAARGFLKLSRRLVRLALPLANASRKRGIGVNFGPVVLLLAFIGWMLLLVLGFGLMIHALSDSFRPPLDGFGHALYVAGGSMGTIGFGGAEAIGWARGVVVAAGFCGLAVMTLAVTYLLEVQSNIAHRDTGVIKITTTAGLLPSALALLERYSAPGSRDQLAALLRDGRDWCATVLQSHASHPWLVYFRSVGTATGWPAALGAFIDAALIAQMLIDDPQLCGPASLARDQAGRLVDGVVTMLRLEPQAEPTSHEVVERLCARLVAAGYVLREDRDLAAFIGLREKQSAPIRALAQHLCMPDAPLIGG